MLYSDLNIFLRNLICFIFLLLTFWNVINALLSYNQKKKNYFIISTIFFIVSYILLMGIKEINLNKNINIIEFFNRIPLLLYILFIVVLLGIVIFITIKNIEWNQNHISQTSYKEAFDLLPAGLCYFRDDGLLILKNHKMNEIAYLITNKVLLNGMEFYNVIKDKSIYEFKDFVIQFRFNDFYMDGIHINEIIADDITELYLKNKELKELNIEVEKTNERMKQYGKSIEENTKIEEILNAKERIHDEFNRLVLVSLNAKSKEEKEKILKSWKDNIFLLSFDMENESAKNTLEDMNTLALMIGLKLEIKGDILGFNDNELKFFIQATKEIMVNAKKHGNASLLKIEIEERENSYTIIYKNDGICPKKFIPSGGLKNIFDTTISLGGEIGYSIDKEFMIQITLRKD